MTVALHEPPLFEERPLRRVNGELRSPEQLSPCGSLGLTFVGGGAPFSDHRPDLSDCLVARPQPWRLVIWEPLLTKAPAPPKAAPHCCYIRTVIFYHWPHIVRPWSKLWRDGRGRLSACKGGFEEWDKVETRLSWDHVVAFEGEQFEVAGGFVVWAKRRWWMCRGARRHRAERAA